MSNQQMKPGRYADWADCRKCVRWIQSELRAGRTIVVATYTKARQFDSRHVAMFKATRSGVFVQRGKQWDCIREAGVSLCSIRSHG